MKRNQRLYTKIAKANKETTGWFNGCVVHHLDHDFQNNNLSNLKCMTSSEHAKIHNNGFETRFKKGDPSKNKGVKHSDETKSKISKTLTGRINGPCSDETKSKISFANSGDKHWTNFKSVSDDTKLKLSITMKGKYIGELNNQAKSITIDGIFFKTYKDAIEYLKISRNEFNRKILPKYISRNKVI